MRKSNEKFFTLLKRGLVKPDDLDEFVIDWWKKDPKARTIADFLGMSESQYKACLEDQFESLDRFYGIERNKRVASKE